MRALGVSLVAIAAIVASLTVARQQRQEEARPQPQPLSDRTPAALDLDHIREAGL